ncbi:unnamed protein product [marine sediment metagenome]|uniref:DNA (cytosine-5-)-methyltransferase n=1 Tax=marine sediment metagenome TaxID=412755 RepID=X1BNA9_9ZZZZ
MNIIYSLCDYSGAWAGPYYRAGYEVRLIDTKYGDDVRVLEKPSDPVYGILAAPPCTDFAVSGAQYWPEKDKDGRTLASLAIIDACLRFILACDPVFWCLENPVGRLPRWLGRPAMYFHPSEYGDPYTKKTALWGRFNFPDKTPIEPIRACKQGSWIQSLGGSSDRTKTLRSLTPPGFARAFFEANQ